MRGAWKVLLQDLRRVDNQTSARTGSSLQISFLLGYSCVLQSLGLQATTPTNQFWSIDFHITVSYNRCPCDNTCDRIEHTQNSFSFFCEEKHQNGGHLFCLVVFTLLQRIAVFAIDRRSNRIAVIFFQ